MRTLILSAALTLAAACEALALTIPATIEQRLDEANGIFSSGPLADSPIRLVWSEVHVLHDAELADVYGGVEMRRIQETVGPGTAGSPA